MTAIDILGWVATAVVVISFTVKDMLWLRAINGTGTILWLIYGGLKEDLPLLVVNVAILMAHFYWFHKQQEGRRKSKKRARECDPTDIYLNI